MGIAIARELLNRILALAAAEPEREVCGLLFGDDRAVVAAEAAANVAATPADSFEIDPQALFAAVRAERAGGPRLVGHYHSHPRGQPEPSARDAAAAAPGALWLIAAAGEVRLWRAQADATFEPVALIMR